MSETFHPSFVQRFAKYTALRLIDRILRSSLWYVLQQCFTADHYGMYTEARSMLMSSLLTFSSN
ncbi:hypothetical protein A0J61_11215 [Choanephora cucurbitarum]|uniref:Uncharacterized protein n=1 Tax=Choanephora cucurbitarum TaxID=101091 RepID=A0A1C7MWA5_9FUNG|nr:hypothetical protein A0J61_11215 [Choanephora cucurbitarum]